MNDKTKDAAPDVAEDPRFISTTGKPVLIALTRGGHTASVTHEAGGTPLHPRFHRAAVMKGVVPLAMQHSVAAESEGEARKDRRALLIGCIAEIVSLANDDPTKQAELFTGDGRPDARAMSHKLGFPVSATERDAAWLEYTDGDE